MQSEHLGCEASTDNRVLIVSSFAKPFISHLTLIYGFMYFGLLPAFLTLTQFSAAVLVFRLQSVSKCINVNFGQFCNTEVGLFFSLSPFSSVFLSCRKVRVTIKRDHRPGCEVKGHVITQPPDRKTRAAVRHHATLLLLAQMHCND